MYSKTFALDNYFMHIPEYVLDEGRELLNSSALKSASKDAKGLWLLRWTGEPDCETEVFVGRKNVKAYSCDCLVFQERKMCCHVSAAIHHIHETVEKERIHRKEKVHSVKVKVPKIQIKNIINKLSEKELKQFILDQTNKSPLIAGELKAQFAHKIDVPNADDKYFYVIKNYTTALSQGKLNEQKFKKLTIYLSNLIHHGEDLCSAKNYREAALILLGLVKSQGIYSSRYRMLSWTDLSVMVHKFLERLMKQELPPAFRQEITGKLRSIYLHESYLVFDAEYNLFTLLYHFTPGQQLVIYRDFTKYIASHYDRDHAVDACFAMAIKQDDLSQLVLFADRHLQNLTVLRRFFDLLRGGNPMLTKSFIQYIYRESKGAKTKNWAFDQWMSLEQDPDIKSNLLVEFIISDNRDDLIPQLRNITGNKWTIYYEQFLAKLERQNKTSLLVNAMVMNDEQNRLIKVLEHYEGVELILQVAPYLNRINQSFLKERLGQSIERHLNTHVGYQSADFILDVFTKLSGQRLDIVIDHLFRMIIKKFPERKHLIKYIKEAAI